MTWIWYIAFTVIYIIGYVIFYEITRKDIQLTNAWPIVAFIGLIINTYIMISQTAKTQKIDFRTLLDRHYLDQI